MKEVKELLKNRNFIHLWLSQIVSQVVVNTLSFLVLTNLFEYTHSPIATSLVWVSYALPAILVGPFASVISDLVDRRKALILTLLAQAATVSIFALLQGRYIYLSYGMVFLYSLFNQFYIPAEAASLPQIVNKKMLPFANSLFFVTVQCSLAFGFFLAGIFYEYLGFGSSLTISAFLLLAACVSVTFLPKLKPVESISNKISKALPMFFNELIEGYQFITQTKNVFLPFLLLIGLQVALSVIVVTIPVLAQDIVKVRPSLAGVVIVAPAAVGALIATSLVSRAISKGIRKGKLIEISLFVLSVSMLVLGSVVPHVYFWLGRTLAIISFFAAGFAYVGSLIPTLTHLQISTPKDKLGRVFGSIWFITTAATVIPVVFSATITEVFGVSLTLTLLGLAGLTMFFTAEVYVPGAFHERVRRIMNLRNYD